VGEPALHGPQTGNGTGDRRNDVVGTGPHASEREGERVLGGTVRLGERIDRWWVR
jgi:hypothetical protein